MRSVEQSRNLSRLALAVQRFVRLGSCSVADFYRTPGATFTHLLSVVRIDGSGLGAGQGHGRRTSRARGPRRRAPAPAAPARSGARCGARPEARAVPAPGPVEGLEIVRDALGRDARAVVMHLDREAPAPAPAADHHPPARPPVFHRVADEVAQDGGEHCRIRGRAGSARVGRTRQGDARAGVMPRRSARARHSSATVASRGRSGTEPRRGTARGLRECGRGRRARARGGGAPRLPAEPRRGCAAPRRPTRRIRSIASGRPGGAA